jgi:hypothetical protein
VVDAERRGVELDVTVGSLEGSLRDGPARWRLVHDVDGSTEFLAVFETDGDGAFIVEGVPAGASRLEREESGDSSPLWWRPVREVHLEPGARTTLE